MADVAHMQRPTRKLGAAIKMSNTGANSGANFGDIVGLGIASSLAIVTLTLSACGGGSSTSSATAETFASQSTSGESSAFLNPHSDAALSAVQLLSSTPGISPFIQQLTLNLARSSTLTSVEFVIAPKAGSISAAVDVSYTLAALTARGYLKAGGTELALPVFGLYAGYTNEVTLNFRYEDGTSRTLTTPVTTADYVDPTEAYQKPTFIKQRVAGSSLGFNFFYIKSSLGSPVVIDTDGEIRWVVPESFSATSSTLQGDQFIIGDPTSAALYQLRLDGALVIGWLNSPDVMNFHHNIDPGKRGLMADVTTETNGVTSFESEVEEITPVGAVLNKWDIAADIASYMTSQGDNAAAFVRPGIDWFHNNAATYDPSDNSVIISGREDFVIKLDYSTGRIIWILGDPTKYWYTFPSLRAKALTLPPGGLYPIGQHAVSINPGGQLMLFNDGYGSINQPAGAPAGESRTFSAVSAYSIDVATMTAQNVWNFEYGQSIYSEVCSSAYATPDRSLLVDYAVADQLTHARLVGLDPKHQIVFDFQYPTQSCDTSWNAVPVKLDGMSLVQ
jgi:arylsulfate sulfotransferase